MELRHLRTLVAIAEEGTLSRAGARLHLVESGLSRHIKELEAEVGVALFVREPNGLRPTEAGLRAIHLARGVLRSVEALPERIRQPAQPVPTLHLGCVGGAFGDWVTRVIQWIRERSPDLEIRIREAPADDIVAAVRTRDLDLGIVPSSVPTDGLRQTALYEEELKVAVPRRGPWSGLDTARLRSVAGEPFILYPPKHGLRRLVDAAFARHGLRPRIALEAESPRVICQAVAQGLGIGIVTATFARNYGGSDVAYLPIEDPAITRTIVLIHRDDPQSRTAPVRLFREGARTILQSPSGPGSGSL